MSALSTVQGIDEFSRRVEQDRLLPIQVSPHYQRLIEEEVETLQGPFGPLYKVAYPTPERIQMRAPGEMVDFVQDEDNMPPGLEDVAIRKYDDRLLILLTEKCAGHCMYCFRQDVLAGQHDRGMPPFMTRVDRVIEYLKKAPEIHEVIFSGGDPLCAPLKHIEIFLRRIRDETSVHNVRVHTRNAVYAPQSFTGPMMRLLGENNVRLVLHVVHPYELAEESRGVIKRLRSCGVRCYAQFPVLRGINDHPRVLERLLEELDNLHVQPLTLFIPDPIRYSASFRIPLARLFSIVNDLNWHTPAWINSVRLVLDTPIGKVRREDIVDWDRERGLITFERDGKQVIYPDFPPVLDVPGELSTLLWKSSGEGCCPSSVALTAMRKVDLFG
jgi:lysine 2,3-aminomutase